MGRRGRGEVDGGETNKRREGEEREWGGRGEGKKLMVRRWGRGEVNRQGNEGRGRREKGEGGCVEANRDWGSRGERNGKEERRG